MKVYHNVILEDINENNKAKVKIVLAIPKIADETIEDVNLVFLSLRQKEFFSLEQINTNENFIFFQGIISLKVCKQYFYYFYWFENNRKKKYRLHDSNMTTERDCWKMCIQESFKKNFDNNAKNISEREQIKKICKTTNLPYVYVCISIADYNKKDLEYARSKVLRYDKKLVLIPKDFNCFKDDEIQEIYRDFLNQKIGILINHIVF